MKKRTLLVAATVGIVCAACVDDSPTGVSDDLRACERGEAIALPVGGVLRDAGSSLCVGAGSYVLVPFVSGPRDTLARVLVSVQGAGLAAAPLALDARVPLTGDARMPAMPAAPDAPTMSGDVVRLLELNEAWHVAFDGRVDAEMAGRLRGAAGAALDGPAREPSSLVPSRAGPPSAMPGTSVHVPSPGETITLNVAASCERADLRSGRVAAVTGHAIVATDPANPGDDPFTQSELESFGREFDDLVYPTITQSFGTFTDLDQNGRVILFFTRAVNEIAAPGSGASLAIGFFFRGDVFPRAGIPGSAAPCAQSNEAEVLFLAVPDPEGRVRVPVNHATLRQVAPGTIAHELQHLINTGRRLHVTHAPVLEETWLNEALSHVAEELMFYAATGVRPRENVDTTIIYGGVGRADAFNRYMYNNLGRFDRFIQSPQDWSLMGTDGHETRGAAWSFLRYAADRDPRDDGALLRALVDGPGAGLDNLTAALGQDPLPLMEDWSVSVLADDLGTGGSPLYQQPSWNLRELISALRVVDRRYPLRLIPLEDGAGFSVRMRVGGAAYPTFSVDAGKRGVVIVRADEETPQRSVKTVLMRVR